MHSIIIKQHCTLPLWRSQILHLKNPLNWLKFTQTILGASPQNHFLQILDPPLHYTTFCDDVMTTIKYSAPLDLNPVPPGSEFTAKSNKQYGIYLTSGQKLKTACIFTLFIKVIFLVLGKHYRLIPANTIHLFPVLVEWWVSVADGEPSFNQHWINAPWVTSVVPVVIHQMGTVDSLSGEDTLELSVSAFQYCHWALVRSPHFLWALVSWRCCSRQNTYIWTQNINKK